MLITGGIRIFLIKKDASAEEYILQALLELLETEDFEAITVKEIVIKAGVSRSTFYLHFQDKYHLMDCLRERITSGLLAYYEARDNTDVLTIQAITLQICQHVFRYKSFYKHELNQPEQLQQLSELLAKRLGQAYKDKSYAIFAGYGTTGYLTYWMNGNFEINPEEAAEQLVKIGMTDWSR